MSRGIASKHPRASFFIPARLVRQFRSIAVEQGKAPSVVVAELIRKYVREHGRKG